MQWPWQRQIYGTMMRVVLEEVVGWLTILVQVHREILQRGSGMFNQDHNACGRRRVSRGFWSGGGLYGGISGGLEGQAKVQLY